MVIKTCFSFRPSPQARLRGHTASIKLYYRNSHSSPKVSANLKGAYIASQYVDTLPPNTEQLNAGTHFFTTHAATKSWTAIEWRKHVSQHSSDLSDIVPEVAFLGRSNSGKSSLLNALLDNPGLCRVGPRPGKTSTMHAWTLARLDESLRPKKGTLDNSEPKLAVLDMPGYGHGSRSEWGQEIIKYMRRRRQLRRAFVLLNPKHGVKASDEQILKVLRAEGIPHQIVACKCDDIRASELAAGIDKLRETVDRSAAEQQARGLMLEDVLAVGNLGDGKANQRVTSANMRGVENVRWAILQAAGLEQYAQAQYGQSLEPQRDRRPLRIIDSPPSFPNSNL